MTVTRKALLLLTASGLVCALLPFSPASANSDKPALPGSSSLAEKKKCLSTGTAKATFSLKADETSKPLRYTVSAVETVCLFYTVEQISAGGKSQNSPVVRRVEMSSKVSHSGYLPQNGNAAAVNLLPYEGRGLVSSSLQPFKLDYSNKESKLFSFYDNLNHSGYGSADSAWDSLLEAGFSCSKGKCRPNKKSATGNAVTHSTSPGDSWFYYGSSYGRMGVMPNVEINTGAAVMDFQESGGVAYWDFGPACGPEACPSGFRAQTSIKTSRGTYKDWYHQSKTFVGLPASLRECGWEGFPVSVSTSC